MNQTPRVSMQEQWRALYGDQEALTKSPEGQRRALLGLAESLKAQGLIDAGELAELLEQADAAYAWGIEAQLSATSDATE